MTKKKLPLRIRRTESKIVAWWYDDYRKSIAIKRADGNIQYVSSRKHLFETYPTYELHTLNTLPFDNPSHDSFAEAIATSLRVNARNNFKDVKKLVGKTMVVKNKNNPSEIEYRYIYYPPPEVRKEVKIRKPMPRGTLKNVWGWRYDPGHYVVIERTDEPDITIREPMDLIMFHLEDLQRLAAIQIRTFNEEDEVLAKDFMRILLQALREIDPELGYALQKIYHYPAK